MKAKYLLVTLGVLLLPVTITWAQPPLLPVLEHQYGRLPDDALPLLARRPFYGKRFVERLMRFGASGYTRVEVETILAERNYDICTFSGVFDSDGLYMGDTFRDIAIGTITRAPYTRNGKREFFACKDGRLWFSGTCGNIVQKQDGIVTLVAKVVKRKPKCVTTEVPEKFLQSVPSVSLGGIHIGSETRVVVGESIETICK